MTNAGSATVDRPVRRRIFFAFWPDQPTRTALARATRTAVRRSGGKATPEANLHVTVAFLGPITLEDLERVRGIPPLPSQSFELNFDKLGYWKKSRVLSVVPTQVPRAIVDLQMELWNRLEAAGFERDRRPYRPHVTIARKAKEVEEVVPSVPWAVSELALVESKPGPRHSIYEVLGSWPFETSA